MPINMKGRSLLTLREFSADELVYLVDRAIDCKRLKRARIFPRRLENRNIGLIFLKPSTRTRASFVVAANDEGANLEVFRAEDLRFGYKESVEDIARVLGRLFDGIAFRGFDHQTAEELAAHAGVPVWNGLTDDHHPTQMLADVMTIKEEFGRLDGVKVAYVGDGRNNVVTSLAIGGLKVGLDLRVIAPRELHPSADVQAGYRDPHEAAKGTVTFTDDIAAGIAGCDVVYTDVWVSMGEDALIEERIRLLKAYKITPEIMAMTGKPNTIFMHCLPGLHDLSTEFAAKYPDILEVDDTVFKAPHSRVFDQSENRMHTIKALMIETI